MNGGQTALANFLVISLSLARACNPQAAVADGAGDELVAQLLTELLAYFASI